MAPIGGARSGIVGVGDAIPDSGLLHEYDATSLSATDGGTISTFFDGAGSADLSATGAPTYQANALNGNPVVRYDGTDDFHHGDFTTAVSQPIEVFFVGQLLTLKQSRLFDGNADEGFFANNNTDDWAMFSGTLLTDGPSDTNPHIFTIRFDGANSQIRIDGIDQITGDAGVTNITGFTIGAKPDGTVPTNQNVGEVRQHDPTVGGYSRTEIESALSEKWGITL